MTISKETEMAFELKKHSANLYITLSTGLLAVGVAFIKDLLGGVVTNESLFWLKWSAGALILCIFFGMVLNHQMSGLLNQKKGKKHKEITARSPNFILATAGQFISFLSALVFIILFAHNSSINKPLTKNYVWIAESKHGLSDLGVYECRNECISALVSKDYRCKLIKK